MPTVGKGKKAKHFPYDKTGKAAAKAEAEKTGETLTQFHNKRMKKGGK